MDYAEAEVTTNRSNYKRDLGGYPEGKDAKFNPARALASAETDEVAHVQYEVSHVNSPSELKSPETGGARPLKTKTPPPH